MQISSPNRTGDRFTLVEALGLCTYGKYDGSALRGVQGQDGDDAHFSTCLLRSLVRAGPV